MVAHPAVDAMSRGQTGSHELPHALTLEPGSACFFMNGAHPGFPIPVPADKARSRAARPPPRGLRGGVPTRLRSSFGQYFTSSG